MPDKPDYVQEVTLRYTGGFIGLEELAARLKSIVPWDLKGNIILAEGFESEVTDWRLDEAYGNSLTSRTSRRKFSGDWSIKFFIDDVENAACSIDRHIAYPGATKLALMAIFSFDDDAQIIELIPTIFSPTARYYPELSYNRDTSELRIRDKNLAYQVIDSALSLGEELYYWAPFRLDVDLATGYYHKAYVADQEYDLSAYQMRTLTPLAVPYVWILARGRTETSSGFTMYVDNVVVAGNVP